MTEVEDRTEGYKKAMGECFHLFNNCVECHGCWALFWALQDTAELQVKSLSSWSLPSYPRRQPLSEGEVHVAPGMTPAWACGVRGELAAGCSVPLGWD